MGGSVGGLDRGSGCQWRPAGGTGARQELNQGCAARRGRQTWAAVLAAAAGLKWRGGRSAGERCGSCCSQEGGGAAAIKEGDPAMLLVECTRP